MFRSSLLVFPVVLLGCNRPGSPGETLAYTEAMAKGARGLEDCQALQDPQLRTDCVSWAARDLALGGDEAAAVAACQALDTASPLRGECLFLVSDALGAKGEQARAICEAAHPFANRCREHAVRRQLATLVRGLARGAEAAAEGQAEAEAAAWLGPQRGRRFARHALAKELAGRPDEVFSRETCGSISAVVCSRAFELRIDAVIGDASRDGATPWSVLQAVCPPPVTLDGARLAGLPAWSPDAEEAAGGAWRRACAKAASMPGARGAE